MKASQPQASEYQSTQTSSESSAPVSFGSYRGWSFGSSSAMSAGSSGQASGGDDNEMKPSSVAYGNFFGMIGGGYAAFKAYELEECTKIKPPPPHCQSLLGPGAATAPAAGGNTGPKTAGGAGKSDLEELENAFQSMATIGPKLKSVLQQHKEAINDHAGKIGTAAVTVLEEEPATEEAAPAADLEEQDQNPLSKLRQTAVKATVATNPPAPRVAKAAVAAKPSTVKTAKALVKAAKDALVPAL